VNHRGNAETRKVLVLKIYAVFYISATLLRNARIKSFVVSYRIYWAYHLYHITFI